MTNLLKYLCLGAFFFVFAAMAAEHAVSSEGGEEIVGSVCNQCHSYSRICMNLERDEAFWFNTVTRMRSNGAPIDQAQIEAAAKYLAGANPESAPFCQ